MWVVWSATARPPAPATRVHSGSARRSAAENPSRVSSRVWESAGSARTELPVIPVSRPGSPVQIMANDAAVLEGNAVTIPSEKAPSSRRRAKLGSPPPRRNSWTSS